MKIEESRNEGIIQLNDSGRVDFSTSSELQERILQAFQKGRTVVVDLREVDYMSSAGLRALLLGQKTASSKGGSLRLVHVQPSVQEVFNVTGFADILTIE